jgi:glyoxylase-like metal-dependent hydrolase (beta-lactamase superfamily II)
MLEGPTSDARSKVVNDLVRKTVPTKPIRYVVNTHAHYDHAGGLREYVAEGITVITHESNKAFFEKAWARPRTLEDTAPTSNKPVIETVGDKRVLSDRSRTVELYHLPGHGHHTGQLIAYLPKERILMYGDGYNPPPGEEIKTPERGPEFAAQLVQRVQELKLNPERIAPVHGRVVPYKNLLMAFNLDGGVSGTR